MKSYDLAGPFIGNDDTIEKTMWNVALALIPVSIAAVVYFGFYSLYLIFGTAIFSVLLEKPVTGQKLPGDGSAFVTGMLLGLSLPPSVPFWLPLVGAFFAIIVAKQLFGGLGNNIFNPALAGRAVVRLSFASYFLEWQAPFSAVTTATPMAEKAAGYELAFFSGEGVIGIWNLFIGNIPGTIGETSALAILIGAAFLFYKGYIGWRIPLSFIGSAGILSLILGVNPLFSIFAGALLLGAFFMATDMVTSPTGKDARLVFGMGCGVLTILIRQLGVDFSGGVTFAILAMNGVSYLFDTHFEGPRIGQIKNRKQLLSKLGLIGLAFVIIILLSWFGFLVIN